MEGSCEFPTPEPLARQLEYSKRMHATGSAVGLVSPPREELSNYSLRAPLERETTRRGEGNRQQNRKEGTKSGCGGRVVSGSVGRNPSDLALRNSAARARWVRANRSLNRWIEVNTRAICCRCLFLILSRASE